MLIWTKRSCAAALLVAAAVTVVGCMSADRVISPHAAPASAADPGLPVAATLAAVPADNPQTPEKIGLGRTLFFDPRLSLDGKVACGSCHDPARAFADGRPASVGVKGRLGQRNAPTVLNA